jgi:tRNA (guanine-N7-)-methyltransferase
LQPGRDPRTYFLPPPCGEAEAFERSENAPGGGNAVDDVWLEVGFGGGEHLIAQALAHPRVGLIGAEPYEAGVAKLLAAIDKELSSPVYVGGADPGLEPGETEGGINIRIHEGDARDVIAALPQASLGRVFVLFPDPWPKTRHHKRRFIQMETLDALARVLKDGAELRFASDDAAYAAWTLERLGAHPAFAWTARRAEDWRLRPPGWPQTRYETKALHGRPVYLGFLRRDRIA